MKFMQAFQMFHDTTVESSELYNYKQKDREPLRNFVRRFMQQRSQIPDVGEFRKTCHPRNVEVNEICDVSFQEQRTREDLESETHEVSESQTREDLESETHEVSESRTHGGLES
jgi:hypothetical protein